MLLKRRSQREEEILAKSRDIEEKIFSLEEFEAAGPVMFYLAKDDEVRTEGMVRKAFETGKKIIVPSLRPIPPTPFNKENLNPPCSPFNKGGWGIKGGKEIIPSLLLDYENEIEEGMFGIMEPKVEFIRTFPIEEIDIVLVPGIAFDESGGRIGFGGGFYDEFLAKLPSETKRWGLAFEFQILEKLPLTERDVSVGRIITEERVISCEII